jgi:hypothetical protein
VLWGLVNIANILNPWIMSFFTKTPITQSPASTLPKLNITNTKPSTAKYDNNGSEKEGSVVKNATTHASAPSGPADLGVRIIAIGIIDPSTGAFVARMPSANDLAAVQFDIGNYGGTSTGTWYFTAYLPTQSGYTYASVAQAPLAPSDHIINTLRFTDLAASGGTFSVSVDPEAHVSESDKSNNYAEQFLY